MLSRQLILAFAAAPSALAYTLQYVGCYSTAGSLTQNNVWMYQSNSYCQTACVNDNSAPVLGLTNGNTCYCGQSVPPSSAKVADSECNVGCTGYGQDDCGGQTTFSVYLTGTENNVGSSSGSETSSSSQTTSSASSNTDSSSPTTNGGATAVTSVAAGKTIVVTESATAAANTSSSSHSGGKTNTAAIAAGVVVGIVALAAIAGGVFFFMRHRRQRAAQASFRHEQQANSYMTQTKSVIPAVRRSPSGPDSRFDSEAMAHRRFSDGSIADNEDFSRRILKVTNPDDRA